MSLTGRRNITACELLSVGAEGFEPSKAEPSDLQSDPFVHFGTRPDRRTIPPLGRDQGLPPNAFIVDSLMGFNMREGRIQGWGLGTESKCRRLQCSEA